MRLRDVRFRYALDQSGVRNFHGGGWPYHKYLKPMGLAFNECSFVAKTATLHPRRGKEYSEPGNMELDPGGLMPKFLFPDCIRVWPVKGLALNAVGLSGPGLASLLERRCWQDQDEPFMISVTSMGETWERRLFDLKCMVPMIRRYLPFRQPFGVQLNISCPNVAHEPQKAKEVLREARASLSMLRILGDDVPLVLKINALMNVNLAAQICEDENCDALCNSNTIPWHDIPKSEQLEMFGTTESPLAKYGGGGISGEYLLSKVEYWIHRAREAGITKPIIAGGGILHPRDVDRLAAAGASAVAVGSVAFLRPWRVQAIINRANELGAQQKFW